MEYIKDNTGGDLERQDVEGQIIFSFPPIINSNCKVLILGTMPGVESLRKKQYYGHGRNSFWKIIYALFNKEPDIDYERRKRFLLENRIALWDVIMKCEREGSSDSNIKNAAANDLAWLFKNYPNIESVCFNGRTAQNFYKRNIAKTVHSYTNMSFYTLPSTSPAYRIRFEQKLTQWELIAKLLE